MGLLFASCSKDVNLSSPTPANNGNQQHAEDALGITIASNQTWVMSKNYTMNIAQWPSDIEVQQIAVMDANPLTTRDAATLAISDKASSIRFEAANGIKQLYAVCIAAGGGEVTVTPIHRDTSNPNSRFGYYYFVKGQDRNIKTAPKFIFEEAISFNNHGISKDNLPDEKTIESYKLIYYDEAGNPSYTFPEGTVTVSNWADFSYARADFYIYNKTKDLEVHLPSAQGLTGASPYAICIPQKNWRWPKERISVVKAYSMFAGFAANSDVNIDWFNYPNTSVLTLEE